MVNKANKSGMTRATGKGSKPTGRTGKREGKSGKAEKLGSCYDVIINVWVWDLWMEWSHQLESHFKLHDRRTGSDNSVKI